MSSQEFISDMKKLFAVCVIYNCFMDDFSNLLFGGHINLFVHSHYRWQPVPFSFVSFHFSIFEHITDINEPW